MRTLVILCIIFFLHGSAFAEPYKGDTFPPDRLFKNMFNSIGQGDVRFEQSVGTKKDSEGNYVLYYQLRDTRNNSLHNEAMMVIRLDNGVWLGYPFTDDEMADAYVIIENAK